MSELAKWKGGRHRYLINYLVFYYGLFFFGFLNHKWFVQVQPQYFTLNRDLAELFLIAIGLPKFLIAHPSLYAMLDGVVLAFPLAIMNYYYQQKKFSVALGMIFTGVLGCYFLLQSCLLHVSLQPCVPYLILSCLFWSNSEAHFRLVLRVARYTLLYVFASAAIWKIMRGAVLNPYEMSHILMAQHSNYLVDNCTEWICQFHIYLIENVAFSHGLYLAATLLELAFVIGFFTKKYDKLLLVLAVAFVFFDQLVMRIPYWAILVSGITLWQKEEEKSSGVD